MNETNNILFHDDNDNLLGRNVNSGELVFKTSE
jgi:hypothetical protein